MSASDDVMKVARERLPEVAQRECGGDNLAILLASYFEPGIEDDELVDSGTWKQGAVDAANKVLDAIHAHYVAAILADRASQEAEIARLTKERDDAQAFVLEFRGIVTDEMVERACLGYWPGHWENHIDKKDKASIRAHMRKALMAANVCESCASVADHWMKRAEAAEAEVSRLTKRVEEAAVVIEPFARVAEHDIGESEDWEDQFRPMGGGHNTAPLITVGDMRAARDFLQKNGGGNG